MAVNQSMRGPAPDPFEEPSIEEKWRAIVDEVKDEYLNENQRFPWIVGFSGGKDSTVVAHAVFEALLDIPPSKRTRDVHIVSNDTRVESPLVMQHLNEVTKRIDAAATSLHLPITVARTKPDPDKTFWVLLIGKGYPSPNQSMRWCTDRLKIQPTSTYIKTEASRSGAAIVVLGVRRDESQTRQRSIDRHRNMRGGRLTEHRTLGSAYIYRPIIDLTLDDVWEILGTFHAPWGGTHRDLIQLYRDSEGGECPVVLSSDEAAGCGTANSRFGCWTCTVVEKDRSLLGFIDSGKHKYKHLVKFRDWIHGIRNDLQMRQAIRRNGKLTFGAAGNHIPGPFTIQARKEILRRLLKAQEAFGDTLITDDELDRIYKHWATELQQEKGTGDE
ncbi:DNA phosphorothioation system sulfurtransferase DndC [Azospirillum baldaniorum]|uniref:DNA phosphorothioation system sulfurtransferase DndC n=1 Tax=Azospirillum baldaniorum TaxID=1064539 RepID=UPI001B3C0F32|nr:DNA phosphorothioation system sulfurtransferase DndC [Azospirillum baldaniorum]